MPSKNKKNNTEQKNKNDENLKEKIALSNLKAQYQLEWEYSESLHQDMSDIIAILFTAFNSTAAVSILMYCSDEMNKLTSDVFPRLPTAMTIFINVICLPVIRWGSSYLLTEEIRLLFFRELNSPAIINVIEDVGSLKNELRKLEDKNRGFFRIVQNIKNKIIELSLVWRLVFVYLIAFTTYQPGAFINFLINTVVVLNLFDLSNHEKYLAKRLAEQQDKKLKMLNELTKGILPSPWQAEDINPSKKMLYFKIKIKSSAIGVVIDGHKIIFDSKLALKNIAYVLQKYLHFQVLFNKNNSLYVTAPCKTEKYGQSLEEIKKLILSRLEKQNFISTKKEIFLKELNEISNALALSAWWYKEENKNDLPEIRYYICLESLDEKNKESILDFLETLYPQRISNEGFYTTIISCDSSQKDITLMIDSLLEKNQYFLKSDKRFEEEIEDSQKEENIEKDEISLNKIDGITNVTKTQKNKSNFFKNKSSNSKFDSKSNNNVSTLTSTNQPFLIPKWRNDKYNTLASLYPDRFKSMAIGSTTVWSYFNVEKMRKKLGEEPAKEFKRIFKKGFIGRGYVKNDEGQVLEHENLLLLKSLGTSGKTRPIAEFKTRSNDENTILVAYNGKTFLHPD